MSLSILLPFEEALSAPDFPSFSQDCENTDEKLRKLGWKLKTREYHGTSVFISPNRKFVARVNTENDYAFRIYADLCGKMKSNPYFQNVHRQYLLHDGTHITIMERLIARQSHRKITSTKAKPSKDLYLFLHEGYKHPDLKNKFMNDLHFKNAIRALWNTIDQQIHTNAPLMPALDLHGGNIMLRPKENGFYEPVMADPLGNLGDPDDDLEQHNDPWDIRLRRMVGLMDPPYFKNLSLIDTKYNRWDHSYWVK